IIGIALVVLIFAEVLGTLNLFMLELLFETLIILGSILITYGTYELKNYIEKH
ncbi:MAG: hypothetical protein GOV15_04805, partial [Candidatus Diapherotrites archaeon]|nr:hypothetical protein [Candidatus Diapherotrites archaeon]